jgi:hypothetical protein
LKANSPLRLEVLGHHGSWLNDASLLGEICLCEGLLTWSVSRLGGFKPGTYSSIRGLSDLLSNQLVGPFLGLGSIIGVDSWDDERHVEGLFCTEEVVLKCMCRALSCLFSGNGRFVVFDEEHEM